MLAPATPVPTPLTQPFWDGCARGELHLPWCSRCERAFFPPQARCPQCLTSGVTWRRASGRGILHTYVIQHRPAPGFEDRVPYAVAIVELAEGPRMMANIVGIPNTPEHLQLDMELEVCFERRGEMVLPVFAPAGQAA